MSTESSPAAAAAPARKTVKPKAVEGFPPAFVSSGPPKGRPSAADAAAREAEARGLSTTETEV